MGQVNIVKHPVLQHKLTLLRDIKTKSTEFRKILYEVSCLLGYEATKGLETETTEVQTPLAKGKFPIIEERPVVVPILRAGMGMLEGLLTVIPFASVGHIGIYRDKFIKNTVEYYFRMPDPIAGKNIYVIDPMLATAETALAALDRLKEYKVGKITFISIVSSQVGIDKIQKYHPDVDIYTLTVEPELNDKGYLVPGLGDAGDRIYHTEV